MMRALSLTQPWATLMAIGAKTIETRSWPTRYRGGFAIHASKGFPADCRELCLVEPFRSILRAAGYTSAHELPLGAILAAANLAACVPTNELRDLTEQERAFGHYGPGRWGWVTSEVDRLATPVPCDGALGLWTVKDKHPGDNLEARILAELALARTRDIPAMTGRS